MHNKLDNFYLTSAPATFFSLVAFFLKLYKKNGQEDFHEVINLVRQLHNYNNKFHPTVACVEIIL